MVQSAMWGVANYVRMKGGANGVRQAGVRCIIGRGGNVCSN